MYIPQIPKSNLYSTKNRTDNNGVHRHKDLKIIFPSRTMFLDTLPRDQTSLLFITLTNIKTYHKTVRHTNLTLHKILHPSDFELATGACMQVITWPASKGLTCMAFRYSTVSRVARTGFLYSFRQRDDTTTLTLYRENHD